MAPAHADVPLAKDASERFLPWLVAFMVYFAALALVSGTALHKLVERWDSGLSGQLTVEVPPPGPEASQADQLARIQTLVAQLNGTTGITSAAQLAPSEIAGLLEPWLGSAALGGDLPLPALIAVTMDETAPPDLDALAAQLDRTMPGTLLDDHQRWLGKLLDLVRSVQVIAAAVVLLVVVCAALTIVFVTRTGLSVHRQAIELLHVMGAHDVYIARQFQRHALKLGLRGGVIGLALAMATILPLGQLLARTDSLLLNGLTLTPVEWGLLVLLPCLTALVAMITARFTVLGTLARMP